jgi:DUF971 family protein
MAADGKPWPIELRVKREDKVLELDFDDGQRFRLPFELLRVESPSAEVRGHGPDQKIVVAGKRRVGVKTVEPVGNYAIRILFDDGHDTGIYSWTYLYELGRTQDAVWRAYADALTARGLTRD